MTPFLTPVDATTRQVEMLAEYYNVELAPHVVRLYVDALRDLPAEDLRAACRQWILTSPHLPKISELREATEAVREDAAEADRRAVQDAARREARGPVSVFGRMSKAAVLHVFRGFIADARCSCVACFDAGVQGPPRFVPDGTLPGPQCPVCDDRGWIPPSDRTDTTGPATARCACATWNPNLSPATRAPVVEMGRWLHGEELRQHEIAQATFEAAMRAWMARAGPRRMGGNDARRLARHFARSARGRVARARTRDRDV